MIGAYRTRELHVPKNSHELEEVHLALIGIHFFKTVQPATDVAHMDLVDLSSFPQILDNGQDLHAWVLQTLGSCSQAQLKLSTP
jgi:hypothetical protein